MAFSAYSATITHWELPGSPKEDASTEKGGSFTANVDLLTPWAHRHALAAEIIGNAQLYPRLPESGARACSCSIKPFEAAIDSENPTLYPGSSSYELAQVSIKYKLEAETSDFVTESLEPTGEMMTLNPTLFYKASELVRCHEKIKTDLDEMPDYNVDWMKQLLQDNFSVTYDEHQEIGVDEDVLLPRFVPGRGLFRQYEAFAEPATLTKEDQGPSRQCYGLLYTLTFHRVIILPQVLVDLNYSMINCVNRDPLVTRLLGITFPPETVLFLPPTARRRWNWTAYPYWELTYKLSWKREGWNLFWNPRFYGDSVSTSPHSVSTASTVSTAQHKYTVENSFNDFTKTAGGYDCFYTKDRSQTILINANTGAVGYTKYKRYRNFPLADFAPAFELDMNISPWAEA
jgi:hypothetical protein